jgi:hypothetical protein
MNLVLKILIFIPKNGFGEFRAIIRFGEKQNSRSTCPGNRVTFERRAWRIYSAEINQG